MPGRIYSVGYEGLELEALVGRLGSAGVTLLVDVRLNPVSRKRGWSRRSLQTALEAAGISYRHEPALGNPTDNRDSFRRGDGEEGRRRMRERLAADGGPALAQLATDARNARVSVLCVERAATRCHRLVITDVIREQDPTIEVLQIE